MAEVFSYFPLDICRTYCMYILIHISDILFRGGVSILETKSWIEFHDVIACPRREVGLFFSLSRMF